jgi:hypothetical protein
VILLPLSVGLPLHKSGSMVILLLMKFVAFILFPFLKLMLGYALLLRNNS